MLDELIQLDELTRDLIHLTPTCPNRSPARSPLPLMSTGDGDFNLTAVRRACRGRLRRGVGVFEVTQTTTERVSICVRDRIQLDCPRSLATKANIGRRRYAHSGAREADCRGSTLRLLCGWRRYVISTWMAGCADTYIWSTGATSDRRRTAVNPFGNPRRARRTFPLNDIDPCTVPRCGVSMSTVRIPIRRRRRRRLRRLSNRSRRHRRFDDADRQIKVGIGTNE